MTEYQLGDTPRVPREPDADEIRKATRAQFWKRIALGAGAAALALVVGFSSWTVYLIRTGQVANRPTLTSASNAAKDAARTADRIEDCTTPGGDCFERAQRQTSGAVAGINTITVRATACLAVVLKQIPDGTTVKVDDVAGQIQQCIQSATATVKPQKVVAAPKLTPAPTSSSSSPPKKPKKHKHPKGAGTPGVPTPTPSPSAGTGLLDPLCDLLNLDLCLLL